MVGRESSLLFDLAHRRGRSISRTGQNSRHVSLPGRHPFRSIDHQGCRFKVVSSLEPHPSNRQIDRRDNRGIESRFRHHPSRSHDNFQDYGGIESRLSSGKSHSQERCRRTIRQFRRSHRLRSLKCSKFLLFHERLT